MGRNREKRRMKGMGRSEEKKLELYEVGFTLFSVNLGRVGRHAEHGGMMISACRDKRSEEENRSLHMDLKRRIRAEGLGFFELDGYYIENLGTEDEVRVREPFLFVPFRPEVISYDDFVALTQDLLTVYRQDCAVVIRPTELGWGLFKVFPSSVELAGTAEVTLDRMSDLYSRLAKGSRKGMPFFVAGVRVPSNSISAYGMRAEGCMW